MIPVSQFVLIDFCEMPFIREPSLLSWHRLVLLNRENGETGIMSPI